MTISIRNAIEKPHGVEKRIFKGCEHRRRCREITPMMRPRSLMFVAFLCGGCSYAPNVPLFGAFFPAWMLCALIGIGLALIVRTLSVVTGLASRVAIPAVAWVLLAMLFGAAGWIFFFRG